MEQFGTEPHKLVRQSDPGTSRSAAYNLDTSKAESEVFEVIKTFGEKGCIANDVEARLPHRASHTVTPRFRPLIDKGYIEETGEKRLGIYGKMQRVVRAVPEDRPRVIKMRDRKKPVFTSLILGALTHLELATDQDDMHIVNAIKLLREAVK